MRCEFCGNSFPSKVTIDGKIRNLQRRRYCLDCSPFGSKGPAGNATRWRRILKLKAIDYKGGKCVRCGYNKCPAALVFHHPDPTTKEGHTSGISSWKRLKEEIDKCELLCSNCHQEIHHDYRYDVAKAYYHRYKARLVSPLLSEQQVVCPQCETHFDLTARDRKYCSPECASQARRKVRRPSKVELERLVWSKPKYLLAKELGVSDAAVEKWCLAYGIKWPGQGHWQRIAAARKA